MARGLIVAAWLVAVVARLVAVVARLVAVVAPGLVAVGVWLVALAARGLLLLTESALQAFYLLEQGRQIGCGGGGAGQRSQKNRLLVRRVVVV